MAGNPQIIVQFVADLTKLAAGAKEVDKAGKSASKGLDWKGVAKWAGAAGTLAVAGKFVTGAVKSTTDLAKATLGLQRATGLDTKTASEWVQLLKERGIGTDTFGKSVLGLSKNMEAWRRAGADTPSMLKELGVSFADVQKGDVGAVLREVSDGLSKIQNPAQKAVAAQKLFGKGGNALIPILGKGSDALDESLGKFDKYGATLDGNVTKSVADMTKSQRELDAAQAGLSVTVGTTLIPAMAGLFSALDSILQVAAPLLKNQTAMKVVIAVLAGAYLAYQAAVIISTVATLGLNAAMLPQILLWGGIVLAIVAVIAVAILLAKNWNTVAAVLSAAFGKIKAAALAVWNWIRANWPLLLAILAGPIGIAVLLIQRYWSQITSAARSAIAAIRSAWSGLSSFISGIVHTIGGYLDRLVTALEGPGNAAKDAAAAVKSAIGKIPGYIEAIVGKVRSAASSVASAIKTPINAVLRAWNGITLSIPRIAIPKLKIGPKTFGGGSFGGGSVSFPDVPLLAAGGVVDRATLALIGEGSGREIVAPEDLLRQIVGEGSGASFTLNIYPRTADAQDVAYGFRRLELLRTGR
jgi:hypothetical protein